MVESSIKLKLKYSKANQLKWFFLFIATVTSLGAYLTASVAHFRIGFPLDDAWIHQTYARNLANYGEWAFIPGQPSGGSTSPLWTAILVPGYYLNVSPYTWTFILGGVLLFLISVVFHAATATISGNYQAKLPWAGLLIIFEWHFSWSAGSGMETLMQAFIVLLIALLLVRKSTPWFPVGLLTGLSIWVRPDGITLLGPIVLTALLINKTWREKLKVTSWIFCGLLFLLLPYMLFNHSLTGAFLPNTFFAKQAEYVDWQTQPIFSRIGDAFLHFLTGPAILLLPGVLLKVIDAIKRKNWALISMVIWMIGYVLIYAFRLPSYQHGRYLIPAMTIYLLMGVGGLLKFFILQNNTRRVYNILGISWKLSLLLVSLGFWVMGIRAYTLDVEFIETEMVTTAKWVAGNLPDEALIAAHDIGALGFFDDHTLVDLAGLISPEVIPFIRDEDKLTDYMNQKNVKYLVVFQDWYPEITKSLVPVFITGAEYSRFQHGSNLTVYIWDGKK